MEWIQWWNQTLVKLFTFGEQEYKGSQSTISVLQKILKLFQDQELLRAMRENRFSGTF